MDFSKALLNYDDLPEAWQKLISLCRTEQLLNIYYKKLKKGTEKERKTYAILKDVKKQIKELEL